MFSVLLNSAATVSSRLPSINPWMKSNMGATFSFKNVKLWLGKANRHNFTHTVQKNYADFQNMGEHGAQFL